MDFWTHQESARRNTFWLVLLYAALVLGFSLLAAYVIDAFCAEIYRDEGWPADQFLTMLRFPLIFFAIPLLVGILTLFSPASLAAGGRSVAESMKGSLIPPQTTDAGEKRLLNVVEEMAIASGVPVPPVYILGNEEGINAFAAGGTINGKQVRQQCLRAQAGLHQHRGIDEIRLIGAAPSRRSVESGCRSQGGFREVFQRLHGLAHGLDGVAEVGAKPDAGKDGRLHGAPSTVGLRRRRRLRGATESSAASGDAKTSWNPCSAVACVGCSWASRQKATSSAWALEAARRSSRKSKAARKRGCASRRNTRLRWRSEKRGCSSQISCIGSENRRGSAVRATCCMVTRSAARR